LMKDEASARSEAVAKARQWVNLGYIRHAATLAAWLASLKAFSLLGR